MQNYYRSMKNGEHFMVILSKSTHWLSIVYKTKRSFGGNSDFWVLIMTPFFDVLIDFEVGKFHGDLSG